MNSDRINFRLAAAQLGCIFLFLLTTIAAIKLFHHQTDDYAVPFFEYLLSIRLAVPPVLALVASYAFIFIGGLKLSDAPRLVIKYLKNSLLQSERTMCLAIAGMLIFSLSTTIFVSTTSPPSYSRFIAVLLGGEQDHHGLVKAELSLLSEKNPSLARNFGLAVKVFEARSALNFKHKYPEPTTARIFVRALSSNLSDESWNASPLRKLALAEAYSIWAQAAAASPFSNESAEHWGDWLELSLSLNEEVAASRGPQSTALLRQSALNNSGNALLYAKKYEEARTYYEAVLKTNRNLSTAGNLVAANILLGRLKEAAFYGSEIREWGMATGKALSEPSSFTSILVNTAFAYLLLEEYEAAMHLFVEAYDIETDNLNALNLALALYLAGRGSLAQKALDVFRYPPLDLGEQKARVSEDYDSCYYLVRSLLISPDAYPYVAAHLYTYLREARTEEQLSKESEHSVAILKTRVFEALRADPTPCNDFQLVPRVRETLTADDVTSTSGP